MTEAILLLEAKGGAPEWFCVLPRGEVRLADGRPSFQVTPAALQAVMEDYRRRGNDLVIDYEHQTMEGIEAPAAGWIKELDPRDDGLWARVEWTDKALGYIEKKEYRYFSPVVALNKERVVTALLHAALTNFPAIANLTPLAARMQADRIAWEETMVEGLRSILGVATDAEIPVVVERLRRENSAWQGLGLGETPEQAQGAVLALRQAQEQFITVQEQLLALQNAAASQAAKDAVEAALVAGKLTPAQRDWALKYAADSPEGFRSYVEQAPKVVPLQEKLPAGNDKPADSVLAAEETAICRAMGIDSEQFAATKKRLADERGDN
jgi:phage I-like protein